MVYDFPLMDNLIKHSQSHSPLFRVILSVASGTLAGLGTVPGPLTQASESAGNLSEMGRAGSVFLKRHDNALLSDADDHHADLCVGLQPHHRGRAVLRRNPHCEFVIRIFGYASFDVFLS